MFSHFLNSINPFATTTTPDAPVTNPTLAPTPNVPTINPTLDTETPDDAVEVEHTDAIIPLTPKSQQIAELKQALAVSTQALIDEKAKSEQILAEVKNTTTELKNQLTAEQLRKEHIESEQKQQQQMANQAQQDLRSLLTKAQTETVTIRLENATLQNSIDELKAQLVNEKTEVITTFQAQLAQKDKELATEKKTSFIFESDTYELQKENNSLNSEITQFKQKTLELLTELNEAMTQLEKLRVNLTKSEKTTDYYKKLQRDAAASLMTQKLKYDFLDQEALNKLETDQKQMNQLKNELKNSNEANIKLKQILINQQKIEMKLQQQLTYVVDRIRQDTDRKRQNEAQPIAHQDASTQFDSPAVVENIKSKILSPEDRYRQKMEQFRRDRAPKSHSYRISNSSHSQRLFSTSTTSTPSTSSAPVSQPSIGRK